PYTGATISTTTTTSDGTFGFSGVAQAPYVIKASDPRNSMTRAAYRLIAVSEDISLATPLIVTLDDGTSHDDPCSVDTNGNGIPDCVDPNPDSTSGGPIVIRTEDGRNIDCETDSDCAAYCDAWSTGATCDPVAHVCECGISATCSTGTHSCEGICL